MYKCIPYIFQYENSNVVYLGVKSNKHHVYSYGLVLKVIKGVHLYCITSPYLHKLKKKKCGFYPRDTNILNFTDNYINCSFVINNVKEYIKRYESYKHLNEIDYMGDKIDRIQYNKFPSFYQYIYINSKF